MGAPHSVAEAIILFDGVCNLCNRSVHFIINRDPGARFCFAPLQSKYGQEQLLKFKIPAQALESIVLIKGNRFYQKSNAALEICRMLNGWWPALYAFKILPAFVRDGVYSFVANNRYKWFGRQEECMIPTPELKARFLN